MRPFSLTATVGTTIAPLSAVPMLVHQLELRAGPFNTDRIVVGDALASLTGPRGRYLNVGDVYLVNGGNPVDLNSVFIVAAAASQMLSGIAFIPLV